MMSMIPPFQPFSLYLKRLEIYKDEYFALSLHKNRNDKCQLIKEQKKYEDETAKILIGLFKEQNKVLYIK